MNSQQLPSQKSAQPDLWLIDGFNLLHACILKHQPLQHWWTCEAQSLLLTWLQPFALHTQVIVVFDAHSTQHRCEGSALPLRLDYAPSADDRLVELTRQSVAEFRVRLVTADRSLGDRCRAAGAERISPWKFRDEWLTATSGEPAASTELHAQGLSKA